MPVAVAKNGAGDQRRDRQRARHAARAPGAGSGTASRSGCAALDQVAHEDEQRDRRAASSLVIAPKARCTIRSKMRLSSQCVRRVVEGDEAEDHAHAHQRERGREAEHDRRPRSAPASSRPRWPSVMTSDAHSMSRAGAAMMSAVLDRVPCGLCSIASRRARPRRRSVAAWTISCFVDVDFLDVLQRATATRRCAGRRCSARSRRCPAAAAIAPASGMTNLNG